MTRYIVTVVEEPAGLTCGGVVCIAAAIAYFAIVTMITEHLENYMGMSVESANMVSAMLCCACPIGLVLAGAILVFLILFLKR